MTENQSTFHNSIHNKRVLVISFFAALFWIIGNTIDVYQFAITGAFYELLSFPMLALIIFLPIISIVLVIKDKFNRRSMALYSLLLLTPTILLLLLN